MGTSAENRTGLSRLPTAKARFVIAGPSHVQAAASLHRLGAQGMARARQTISTPVCQVQVNTRSPEYHQSEKRMPSTRRTAPCHAPVADARAADIVGIGRPVASTGRKQVSPNANAEVVWVVRTPATIAPANRIERITLPSPKKSGPRWQSNDPTSDHPIQARYEDVGPAGNCSAATLPGRRASCAAHLPGW